MSGKIVALAATAVFGVIGLLSIGQMWENLDAREIMVIQSPFSGNLAVFTDPGLKWQGFGKVTKYARRAQYSFAAPTKEEGNAPDTSKRLRFNDGGHANLSGAVSWEMPLDPKAVINIHKSFGSMEGIEQQAVAKMLDAAVYLAGPLMSSTESSGERRAELVQYINDQAENGVYVTKAEEVKQVDPITNQEKSTVVTKIMYDASGSPKRQQGSILKEFKIMLFPLSISNLAYDSVVENQIKQRQEATTQVQIAVANARRAEQDAITIAKQGEAKAATAKWEQETIKAKEVTLAQQKLEVATLSAKEAEQYKREQILRGEGDAQRKSLVMLADGALDQKLEAYKQINLAYADAIKSAQPGAWTPTVIMGGSSGNTTGGAAQSLVDMLTAKTATQLGLDMSVLKGNTAKK